MSGPRIQWRKQDGGLKERHAHTFPVCTSVLVGSRPAVVTGGSIRTIRILALARLRVAHHRFALRGGLTDDIATAIIDADAFSAKAGVIECG